VTRSDRERGGILAPHLVDELEAHAKGAGLGGSSDRSGRKGIAGLYPTIDVDILVTVPQRYVPVKINPLKFAWNTGSR